MVRPSQSRRVAAAGPLTLHPLQTRAYSRRGPSCRTLAGATKFAISLQGRGGGELRARHRSALVCPFSGDSKQRVLSSAPPSPKDIVLSGLLTSSHLEITKAQRQVLTPFSQRRKPILICGCKSRRAGPSPGRTLVRNPSLRLPSVKVAPAHYKCHHVPVCLHGKWLSKVTSSYPPIFQARSRRLEGLLLTPGSAKVRARPAARSPSAQRRHAPCLLVPSMLCVCWVQV